MPRRVQVNANICQNRGPRNQHEEEKSGRTGSEPCCIGTQIAGLPALQNGAREGGDSAEQPSKAAENSDVDDPIEDKAGERKNGLDDDSAVELVDPVLMNEDVVSRWKRRGKLGGAFGLDAVEAISDKPAEDRYGYCESGERPLEAAASGFYDAGTGGRRQVGSESLDAYPASAD